MIVESKECRKLEELAETVAELKDALYCAQLHGVPLHIVERDIARVLVQKMGRLALEGYIEMHGVGDVGPVAVSPQGEEMDRLPETKVRGYVSVFGPVNFERTVYSAGNKQREYCPLDAILGLPGGKFSFVVQDFAQMLGVDLAWARSREALERLLGIKVPVSSLEDMNREMAEDVPEYRQQRKSPLIEQEGAIFVASGDGKGIVMRKPKTDAAKPTPSILPPETKGPKPGRKNMSIVGTLYSVDPYVRTPDQMLEILFRETERPNNEPPRPRPCGKHVWAAMDDEVIDDDGVVHPLQGLHTTFDWMAKEWHKRDPRHRKPLVRLMDGEHRLWEGADMHLPIGGHPDDADILDIMHVADYLWDAAVVFETHRERQEAFYHERLRRILHGEVRSVIASFKAAATRRGLRGKKREAIDRVCRYFEGHAERMRYDEYLRKGYPIASGAVEGACRHLIKDRLERTGMRWVRMGAQSMLNLRSLWINGEWDGYQQYYIDTEFNRLYPDRKSLLKQNSRRML
jgi:hypothetical protein